MNILRYLREKAKDYDCGVCGANHARSEIRLVGKLDGAWLVRVTCASCDTSLKLLVYDRQRRAPAAIGEEPSRRHAPITFDEVIDAHELLERYQGDARALFTNRARVGGSTEA